jgi:hypothetical protein
MKIGVAIAHAAWDIRRAASLARIVQEVRGDIVTFRSEKREHASVWARRIWKWIAEEQHGYDAVIVLNDDVTVAPKLREIVGAILEACRDPGAAGYTPADNPGTIICLHTTAPVSPSLAMCGERWLSACWLTGPGYVLTSSQAEQLVRFWDRCPNGFAESVNEDNIAMQWATSEAREMLHVIPALVEHDTSIPSTLGYDDHDGRVPLVTWRDVDTSTFADPETWKRVPIVSTECTWFPRRVAEQIRKTLHTEKQPAIETPGVALAIIHARHRPERAPLLERLLDQLTLNYEDSRGWPTLRAWYVEDTKAKHWVWQAKTLDFFDRAMPDYVTHALTLQDDVTTVPNFWPWLDALLRGRPNDVICLDCAHPAARQVFIDGKPGYTSADCMVGIGHVLPVEIARDFRRWRLEEVKQDFLEWQSEDVLLGLFCMARQLRIFSPVPCIIDHDLEVASTNGYEGHLYRRPQVTWRELERLNESVVKALRLEDPAWWAQPVDHVGRFYENAHRLFPLALKDTELAQWLVERYEWDCEKTPPKFQRFFARASAVK